MSTKPSNIDRTGARYGRLVVIAEASRRPRQSRHWVCRCDCGSEAVFRGGNLGSGRATSCGCSQGKFKHGMYKSPEFRAWCHAKDRCFNPSSKEFANYGARGITMCAEWMCNFEQFFHDVGPRPTAGHSLDRINNDGSYEPGNVRWATLVEQLSNTRQCRYVEIEGEKVTIAEAARRFGVVEATFRGRINRGLSVKEAARTVSYPDKGCRRPPETEQHAAKLRRSAAH